MIKRKIQFCLFAVFCLVIISCQKEKFTTSGDFKLQFSTDTISFDTIFTRIGSVTQRFTVKNPSQYSVRISRIFLAGGEKSPFRININGVGGDEDQNVTISSGDSIYIFAEVTVDPTGQNNPMIIKDSIVFNVNGNIQDVKLAAFGQDVHLYKDDVLTTQHWKNDKPYLIYRSIMVGSSETLTIESGCRVHFHKGASLFVKGTLNVKGTFEERVKFLGDRLESGYADVPSQWGAWEVLDNKSKYIYGGIHFLKGSKDNIIDYAVIKNANKGIQLDSMGFSDNPMLVLSNSRIENMSLNCIDARTTNLKAFNCIFANSGSYCVALSFGGNYEFDHCTVANYFSSSSGIRKEPALILNNYYTYGSTVYAYDLAKADFANCIIYGAMDDEISLDKVNATVFNYRFQNCLIKNNSSVFSKDPAFLGSIFNNDPKFTDISKNSYSIDSLSPAKNVGDRNIATQFPTDLNGNSRLIDEGPDLGALEWKHEKKKKELKTRLLVRKRVRFIESKQPIRPRTALRLTKTAPTVVGTVIFCL